MSSCVPDGKLEFFATNANHLHLEVNTYCGGEVLEGVGGEAEEEAALADAGVADKQQLEEVVELGLLAQAGRGGGGIHEDRRGMGSEERGGETRSRV